VGHDGSLKMGHVLSLGKGVKKPRMLVSVLHHSLVLGPELGD